MAMGKRGALLLHEMEDMERLKDSDNLWRNSTSFLGYNFFFKLIYILILKESEFERLVSK